MKFHIDHILDNLEQQPSHDELSNKLLQLGHENEKINKINKESEIDDNIDPLHLVILIAEKIQPPDPQNLPLFGVEEGIYLQHDDRPGLMTKREI